MRTFAMLRAGAPVPMESTPATPRKAPPRRHHDVDAEYVPAVLEVAHAAYNAGRGDVGQRFTPETFQRIEDLALKTWRAALLRSVE